MGVGGCGDIFRRIGAGDGCVQINSKCPRYLLWLLRDQIPGPGLRVEKSINLTELQKHTVAVITRSDCQAVMVRDHLHIFA